jgi:enamine deaminase RidA (YjgF/YER057c/UK114 family)
MQQDERSAVQHVGSGDLVASAVVHNGVAYLSGLTDETGEDHSTYEQTRIILAEMDRCLASVGSHRARLLSAQIWLTDLADFDAMNRAWMEWLGDAPRPARACVGAQLAGPRYRVEIMATAAC